MHTPLHTHYEPSNDLALRIFRSCFFGLETLSLLSFSLVLVFSLFAYALLIQR